MLFRYTDSRPKRPELSLLPDYIADSVSAIDFTALRTRGITTCFIDLDGTVVARGTFEVTPVIMEALRCSQLDIYIATNRPRSRDLRTLEQDLGAVGVIHPSGVHAKPSRRYFTAALTEHGLQPAQVVMIGDRFIQDILGANGAGLQSLLVRKIGRPKVLADRLFSASEHLVTSLLASRYKQL